MLSAEQDFFLFTARFIASVATPVVVNLDEVAVAE